MISIPSTNNRKSCEFAVRLIEEDDTEFVSEAERWKMLGAGIKAGTGKLDEKKIGGTPVFMQGDEFPFEGNWIPARFRFTSTSVMPEWVMPS